MLIGDPIIGAIMGVGSFWLCRFRTFVSKSFNNGRTSQHDVECTITEDGRNWVGVN